MEVTGQLHALAALERTPGTVTLESGWTPVPVWKCWQRKSFHSARIQTLGIQPIASLTDLSWLVCVSVIKVI
jgi:hypothetical protein